MRWIIGHKSKRKDEGHNKWENTTIDVQRIICCSKQKDASYTSQIVGAHKPKTKTRDKKINCPLNDSPREQQD